MKKTICSIFTLFFLWTNLSILSAQKVTVDAAKEKAVQFLTYHSKACAAKKAPRKYPHLILANNRDEFYVFNDEANGCFIIVSADERMPSILGYSDHSFFDSTNIPYHLNMLLEGYADQVRYMREQPMDINKAYERELEEWEYDYIQPMLSTRWYQEVPYYNQCPTIGGEHCLTGCEATAMAQIMAYYEWPEETTMTIPGYTTETRVLNVPAIEPTIIDWGNILPTYISGQYNSQQAEAVATLMKLCGASVKMDYNLDESGACGWSEAFVNFFDYDVGIHDIFRDDFEQYDWEKIIHNELHEGRPVIYQGHSDYRTGHIFVIDGYDGGKDVHLFHINMGWSGYADGYYLLYAIREYTNRHGATINIYPNDPQRPALVRAYGVIDNEQLTLYYDNQYRSHPEKTLLPRLQDIRGNDTFTRCVIDPSLKDYALTSLEELFNGCKNLQEIVGFENLNTSMLTDISNMFTGCSSLTSLDLSSFDTKSVKDMWGMFQDCSSLKSINLDNFNTGKVERMGQMFASCSSLESLNLSSFDTSGINSSLGMYGMFHGCSSLKSLDLSHFKTENVPTFGVMFKGCSSLESLDISGFNVEKADATYGMFLECTSLTSLDLSSFNTKNIKNMEGMFEGCESLKTIYVSDGWNTDNVESSDGMFRGCYNLMGGASTAFSWNHIGVDYAHVDGGLDNPGYFTYKESSNDISVITSKLADARIYDLQGMKLNKPKKGLNIVVTDDGIFKKIVIR